jgi:hypothetical protein
MEVLIMRILLDAVPARKIGYGLQLKFNTNNLRASIRAINVIANVLGKQNISKK